ncbi:YdcF family protein [Patescibacteria group bacterium]|nr:YdcF family protein [Patescibacteria group bacterium]
MDTLASPLAKLLERREDALPLNGVDYAIGFGIGMRENGEPSLLSEGVARRCTELFKAGLAENIIFTGGLYEGSVTEAKAMKDIALALGVPEERIFIEEFSRNTYQNAVHVLSLMRQRGLEREGLTIATVGQNLHAGRCYYSFKKEAPSSWKVFLKKAYSEYDPECTSRRLTFEWRFLPWEIIWTILFRIKPIRSLIF